MPRSELHTWQPAQERPNNFVPECFIFYKYIINCAFEYLLSISYYFLEFFLGVSVHKYFCLQSKKLVDLFGRVSRWFSLHLRKKTNGNYNLCFWWCHYRVNRRHDLINMVKTSSATCGSFNTHKLHYEKQFTHWVKWR